MIRDIDLRVLPEQAARDASIRKLLVRDHGVDPEALQGIRILRRSIDARQRTIYVNLRVRVWLNEAPTDLVLPEVLYPDVTAAPKTAVVVGAGPAGLFAALRLIERNIRPIVVERGQSVHERKKDIATISREHRVDPESNYSFGEGGAGAFSDGKLYTRSKKRGNVEGILQTFCRFGADPNILVDAHPHIGTDKLPRVIENMRNRILASGGEVHFGTRMEDLLLQDQRVCGIRTADGREFRGPVILATGHSARDVYRLLSRTGIRQEAKSLALGVRLEHPSALIDQIQYHRPEGRGEFLPAAEYSLVTQVHDRGVYSFCMCPGGFVVPAASGPEQVVVNGMSASGRNSRWSNAGLVVEFHPQDIDFSTAGTDAGTNGETIAGANSGTNAGTLREILREAHLKNPELLLMEYQTHLERLTWQQGGCRQTAPCQRMGDFVANRLSANLPASSYTPGTVSSPLHEWLPAGITGRLQQAFQIFDKSNKGFLTNEALLLAVETRTSSPVRILRDAETLRHIETEGLYPCGEGAGYAGGIVSAAIDGERCADSLAAAIR